MPHRMFVVTGASGAGKSTVRRRLEVLLPDYSVFDLDPWIERNRDDNLHRAFLLEAATSTKPVVLCGAVIPENFEPLPERKAFGVIQYLALVCEETDFEPRLSAREGWSVWGGPAYLAYHRDFNRWLKANAALTNPPMELLSTSGPRAEETTTAVLAWIARHAE